MRIKLIFLDVKLRLDIFNALLKTSLTIFAK